MQSKLFVNIMALNASHVYLLLLINILLAPTSNVAISHCIPKVMKPFFSFADNLEVVDDSEGKSYIKKIIPDYEEVVIEGNTSLSFVSFIAGIFVHIQVTNETCFY